MTTWSIDKITAAPQVGGFSDVVKEVAWRCTAQSGDTSQSTYGTVIFTISEDTFEDFTTYEELTEQQVIAWVKTSLGEQGVAYQENLAQRLANEIANPLLKATPLPW